MVVRIGRADVGVLDWAAVGGQQRVVEVVARRRVRVDGLAGIHRDLARDEVDLYQVVWSVVTGAGRTNK